MHLMKKTGALLLAAVFSLSMLAGCSKKETKEISIPDTVQAVFDAAGFSEELVQLDDSIILNSYKTLDLTQVSEYVCYVSGSMGTPEEVAIFKAKSADGATSVLQAVNRRVDDQQLAFEDYRPDEMPKIDNALVLTKGDYVLFCIAPNSDAVRKVFDEL